MTNKTESTKEQLLITAGKLFAIHGYDGVSTRMIADMAQVKLSGIHYHFGSKENLYLEAFSYAKGRGNRVHFLDVAEENPALIKSKEGQAEIIKNTIFRRFHDHFRPDKEVWETQLLVREIISSSSAMPVLSQTVFKPEIDAAESFFKLVKPNASANAASVWCDMFHSQLCFYSMAREPICHIRGEEALNLDFIQEAARNLSRAMILVLDLPLPKDLQ